MPPPPPGSPPAPPPSEQAALFSQPELDQMLAPIALYPDPLLSQILMAATYPLEIVEAARWVNANPGLQGDEAVRAVAAQPWDPSVKSLVAFPQILTLMDQRLDWTQSLGNAFLAQQTQVMDTVQGLRMRANSAGNLRSGDQMQVEDQDGSIVLEPVNPQVAYVPYYDPLIVYGPWWWPNYPPVYWPPWPGYYVGPGILYGFAWGVGVAISAGFFFGALDWHHHRVDVAHVNNYYYHSGRVNVAPGQWHHDPDHRRGVPYRGDSVQQRYSRAVAPPPTGSRSDFRGREPPSVGQPTRPIVTAPAAPAGRPQAPPVAREPAPRAIIGQPTRPTVTAPAAPAARPQPRAAAPEPAPRAFEGIQAGGAQTREFSARGRASMQPHVAPAQRSVPAHTAPAPRSAPARGAPSSGGGQHR
ncbi:MAG: DUF3300 domain-containing protein [Burkholderiales bacterium]